MAFHLQTEWFPLVGQRVVIRRHGHIVRHGTVDAVTLDDGVLWLNSEGTAHRQLFERSAGFEVWIAYRWENGSAKDIDWIESSWHSSTE
ncbi:hypothetical protein [Paenarthrobacter aromaticivorans]|uniref:hypothetical protein n=1 Tax=Paenarthrobacter aromaticivorans TaxID=2849150 RepID=UPI003A7FD88B